MVKATNFDRHPVKITKGILSPEEEAVGTIQLEALDAVLASGSLSTGSGSLKLASLAATAGIDIPDGAAALIARVNARDSGANATNDAWIALGYKGIIDITTAKGAAALQIAESGRGSDFWQEGLMIIPLNQSKLVDYVCVATGSTTLDYQIKLVGWLIKGTAYTLPTHPQKNLKAVFSVKQ
jgi:hypothetical protein